MDLLATVVGRGRDVAVHVAETTLVLAGGVVVGAGIVHVDDERVFVRVV